MQEVTTTAPAAATRSIGTDYECPIECICQCESLEVASRIQFIRTLALSCNNHGVQWSIVGGFLRRILSGGQIAGSNLDVIISPFQIDNNSYILAHAVEFHNKVQAVFMDLEVLGVVTKPFVMVPGRPYSWMCEAAMAYDTTFEVIVDAFPAGITNTFSPTFSSDGISLTHTALQLSAMSPSNVDRVNMCHGISILERIAELRFGSVRMVARYHNDEDVGLENDDTFPEDPRLRRQNAHLMLREYRLAIDEGLDVVGALRRAPHASCPVCFEASDNLVELACSHAFCIPCLARHMAGNGNAHGRCPMCRRTVRLCV